MSLREEMWKYEQITGESAEHVPIIKLGAFLDGYDAAIKALEQKPCEEMISRADMLDAIGHGTTYTTDELQKIIKGLPTFNLNTERGNL